MDTSQDDSDGERAQPVQPGPSGSFGFDRWIELALAIALVAVTATQCSVTKDQWTAMKESNDITRAGYSAGNRAFVTSNSFQLVTYGKHDPEDKDGTSPIWIITPVIENTGNTPTRSMTFSSDVSLAPVGVSNDTFEKKSPYAEKFDHAIIPPKSSVTGFMYFLRPPMLGDLAQRKGYVGAFGAVRYKDVFGKTHLTEFCYTAQFVPIDFSKFPVGQPIRVGGVPCERHNCLDDECGADWEKRAQD